MVRNDETTLLCLSNLHALASRAGGDLERAAVKHLATDLGYTLYEVGAVSEVKMVSEGVCNGCALAETCAKTSPCPCHYDEGE